MKTYLELEEISLLENEAANHRDRLLIRVLFRTGCRVSEALAIRVEDIDFEHGTITIRHLKARLRLYCSNCRQRLGRRYTFCPKCGVKVGKAQAEEQQQAHRQADMRAL